MGDQYDLSFSEQEKVRRFGLEGENLSVPSFEEEVDPNDSRTWGQPHPPMERNDRDYLKARFLYTLGMSPDPRGEYTKLQASELLGQAYGVDTNEAYNNFDVYMKNFTGQTLEEMGNADTALGRIRQAYTNQVSLMEMGKEVFTKAWSMQNPEEMDEYLELAQKLQSEGLMYDDAMKSFLHGTLSVMFADILDEPDRTWDAEGSTLAGQMFSNSQEIGKRLWANGVSAFEVPFIAAARIGGSITPNMDEGVAWGTAFGTAAAVTSSAATLGADAPLIPAQFLGGYTLGFTWGVGTEMMKAEAGLALMDLMAPHPETGERMDINIARYISLGIGVVNGAIEMVQLDTLPGIKELKGPINRAIGKSFVGGAMKESIFALLKDPLINTAEEIAQEAVTIYGQELARQLNNEIKGTEFDTTENREIMDQLARTGVDSFIGMLTLGGLTGAGGAITEATIGRAFDAATGERGQTNGRVLAQDRDGNTYSEEMAKNVQQDVVNEARIAQQAKAAPVVVPAKSAGTFYFGADQGFIDMTATLRYEDTDGKGLTFIPDYDIAEERAEVRSTQLLNQKIFVEEVKAQYPPVVMTAIEEAVTKGEVSDQVRTEIANSPALAEMQFDIDELMQVIPYLDDGRKINTPRPAEIDQIATKYGLESAIPKTEVFQARLNEDANIVSLSHVNEIESARLNGADAAILPDGALRVFNTKAVEITGKYETVKSVARQNPVGEFSVDLDGEQLIAHRAGAAIGQLDFTQEDNGVRIDNLEVDPIFRRQGVGTRIVNALKEQNPGQRILWPEDMTPEARALRESLWSQNPKYQALRGDYLETDAQASDALAQLQDVKEKISLLTEEQQTNSPDEEIMVPEEDARALKLAEANLRELEAKRDFLEASFDTTPENYRAEDKLSLAQQRLEGTLQKYFPRFDNEAITAGVELFSYRATSAGMDLETYVAKTFAKQDIFSREAGLKLNEKGAAQFLKDGRALIRLGPKADFSTIVHELAHIARRQLAPETQKSISIALGVNKDTIDGNRAAEEAFARGFEEYLLNGSADNVLFQNIFTRMKGLMRQVYSSRNLEEYLQPELKEVFESVLFSVEPDFWESNGGDQTTNELYQIDEELDQKNFLLHNLSTESLGRVKELGGLPTPFLESLDQRTFGYGDFTIILDGKIAENAKKILNDSSVSPLDTIPLGFIKAAVVPKETPAETRAILENAGIPVYEYGETNRWNKVLEAAKETDTLFQKTDSPEFKAWFGDSKVVDEDGQPLVVYHGTDREIESFRGSLHFFTADRINAEDVALQLNEYAGNVIPAFLSLQNPIDIRDPDSQDYKKIEEEFNKNYQDALSDHREGYSTSELIEDLKSGRLGVDEGKGFQYEVLQKIGGIDGVDGIIFRDLLQSQNDISYVAFSPNQIKSVYNRGTFDPNDDRILYQTDDSIEQQYIDRHLSGEFISPKILEQFWDKDWAKKEMDARLMNSTSYETAKAFTDPEDFIQDTLDFREAFGDDGSALDNLQDRDELRKFWIEANYRSWEDQVQSFAIVEDPGLVDGIIDYIATEYLENRRDKTARKRMNASNISPLPVHFNALALKKVGGKAITDQDYRRAFKILQNRPKYFAKLLMEYNRDEIADTWWKDEIEIDQAENPEDYLNDTQIKELRAKEEQERLESTPEYQLAKTQEERDILDTRLGQIQKKTAEYKKQIDELETDLDELEKERDYIAKEADTFTKKTHQYQKQSEQERARGDRFKEALEETRRKRDEKLAEIARLRDLSAETKRVKREISKELKRIFKKPSPRSVYWRHILAIEKIQDSLDPGRIRMSSIIDQINVELADAMDAEVWKTIRSQFSKDEFRRMTRRDLAKFKLMELVDLRRKIERIQRDGIEEKVKRDEAFNKDLYSRIGKLLKKANDHAKEEGVQMADPEAIGSQETKDFFRKLGKRGSYKTLFLNPERVMEHMDGGFKGPFWEEFYRDWDNQVQMELAKKISIVEDVRVKAENVLKGYNQMQGTKIKPSHASKKFKVLGSTWTVSEMVGIWASTQNQDQLEGLIYGHNMANYQRFLDEFDKIPEYRAFRAAAEIYMDKLEELWPELYEAHAELKNQTLHKTPGRYWPRYVKNKQYSTLEQQAINELGQQTGVLRGSFQDGFTKARIKVSPQHRKPQDLDFFGVVNRHFDAVSRYIASAQSVKMKKKIVGNYDFRDTVSRAYGDKYLQELVYITDEMANPEIYKVATKNPVTKFFNWLRNNATSAFLAYNHKSFMMQTPSAILVAGYMKNQVNFFKGIAEAATKPMETYRFVTEDPQMKERYLDRSFMEAEANANDRERLVKRIREIGFMGFRIFDSIAITVAYRGLYLDGIAQGMDEAGAREFARDVVTRTQPSGHAKDLPRIMKGGEMSRWLTMFGTQLAQLHGMIAHDSPMMMKEGLKTGEKWKVRNSIITMASVFLAGLITYIIRNGRPPEDEEEWIKYTLSQGTSGFFGVSHAIQGLSGFGSQSPIPAQNEAADSVAKLGQLVNSIWEGKDNVQSKLGKALEAISDFAGISFGAPGYIEGKRVVQGLIKGIEENSAYEGIMKFVGWRTK
jgi:GNAT superfamily N-acetyltransferase